MFIMFKTGGQRIEGSLAGGSWVRQAIPADGTLMLPDTYSAGVLIIKKSRDAGTRS